MNKVINTILEIDDFERVTELVKNKKPNDFKKKVPYSTPNGAEWLPIMRGKANVLSYGGFTHRVESIQDISCEYWKCGGELLNCFTVICKFKDFADSRTRSGFTGIDADEIIEHRMWTLASHYPEGLYPMWGKGEI